MKAWQYTTVHGKLQDSLTWNESALAPDKHSLGADQLIVEVISTSLNPVDYKLPESGLLGTKHDANTANHIGQLVFGGLPHAGTFGGLAQYLLTSTRETVPLPDGVEPDDAAAVGTAATTAYQSLLPGVDISGWRVFLNGGSGGVGSWAVQMARTKGAQVTVSCSTANVDFCKELGAADIIDYKKNDVVSVLKQRGQVFDLVVDNINDEEIYANSNAFLKSGGWFCQVGVAALTVASSSRMIGRNLRPAWLSGGRNYRFIQQTNASEYLVQIGEWIVQGKMRPIIDQTYELEKAKDAIIKLREGRTRGKIVVHVGK